MKFEQECLLLTKCSNSHDFRVMEGERAQGRVDAAKSRGDSSKWDKMWKFGI